MGKRHDIMRKCAQVRDLIQENKFVQALEVIDTISLTEVAAIEDLYLFADLYEKAERLEKKKEIFLVIYNRTKSRYILNRLLRLVIRMGDMEEARELFLVYEFAGAVTLETFELRYLLAKAEGESRATLINILEDLKKEEYTEEWGYQLARLYEQEGMREECIQECKDLILWFGSGSFVEKAKELKERCEAVDWQPPKDEGIPELEMPEPEERILYAAPPVGIRDLDAVMEAVTEPEEEQRVVLGDDRDMMADGEWIEEEQKEELPPKELLHEEIRKEDIGKEGILEGGMEEAGEYVSEPVVVKKEQPSEPSVQPPVAGGMELPEDEHEDISERGILYRTLKSTIAHVRNDGGQPHFVFAGGEERIVLAVAKRITKELNHVGYLSARSIVKITADKLNDLELSDQIERLAGGCMLVTDAPEMNEKTVNDLLSLMEENGDRIVVMLSGSFDETDCFLSIYPGLSEKLIYKIHM